MPTFLKKCPSCGKRFEVERTGEKISREDFVETRPQTGSELMRDPTHVYADTASETVIDTPAHDVTVPVEKETDTETFTCKHCGYVWTETHETIRELRGK